MLWPASVAFLLPCVTSIFAWPFLLAQELTYRGCAYRAVAGKEQALWFCLADNQCAMFHCQDNNVFSSDDCGCVPPRTIASSSQRGQQALQTTLGSFRMPNVSAIPLIPTSTPAVLLSGGGAVKKSENRQEMATCAREIHIEGISVQGTVLGEGTQPPHHADLRGVVAGDNGSAYFNGYSSLSIPTYANAKFDTGVTLDFVVEEGNSRLRQVLVTNCKHGKGPSLEVLLDVELGVVLFHLAYKFRVAANAVESSLQVAVPYTFRHNFQATVPKRVVMSFDGYKLRGSVNDNERVVTVQGTGDYVVAQRTKPLMFGNTLCDVEDVYSYRGQLREISVYKCPKSLGDLTH
ncbi:uncharacterized protein LOC112561838 isoform X1 [Pomacea canaliculata]|uniref:uncharacterized protein LOC112561838 isoform X1 n=1 Tax=Pomacea canaliculata TaxID=400727 RepID=UPI000D72CA37|nr:uncharacterized protein LOC112561838 isoform X1 [Pomacea canaliculata]XP_025090395.1 uncharacterized protein LOC112561838 isoform X1 [Pomacea canaliculata]XP_025090396.1 uncharacterized protein LOC112561838 isoform X1 [Pomacea canaliculata]XP_025090397.1 uncharacterized protein LOC112561838 isoform X1 [Pomacea canaliculata]XP_025090399.1 uncharacterized protein LOC112561838 isoform X1 [Pomacea canaliculata]XP_025090400.1 uncharacterized protein LOC112561838 isoform X1 [Pomacea canaliculata]